MVEVVGSPRVDSVRLEEDCDEPDSLWMGVKCKYQNQPKRALLESSYSCSCFRIPIQHSELQKEKGECVLFDALLSRVEG